MRFALKGRHKIALWNPFRVRVRMVREPGAAFIRIRGFSCPRLICASLSGSIKKANRFQLPKRSSAQPRELVVPGILDTRGKSEVVSSDITHGDMANLVEDNCLFADDKQVAATVGFCSAHQSAAAFICCSVVLVRSTSRFHRREGGWRSRELRSIPTGLHASGSQVWKLRFIGGHPRLRARCRVASGGSRPQGSSPTCRWHKADRQWDRPCREVSSVANSLMRGPV